jgi:uncharacterized delta-60 repeat protein
VFSTKVTLHGCAALIAMFALLPCPAHARLPRPANAGAIESAHALALQRLGDGRLLLAGKAADGRFFVARFGPDGLPDTSFGKGDGLFASRISGAFVGMVVDSRGRVVVGFDRPATDGGVAFRLLRLRSAGTFDPTFGMTGVAALEPQSFQVPDFERYGRSDRSIAVRGDGSILVAGVYEPGPESRMAVASVSDGGSVEHGFGNNGVLSIDADPSAADAGIASQVVVRPDDSFAIIGRSSVYEPMNRRERLAIAQFGPDGAPDPRFAVAGRGLYDDIDTTYTLVPPHQLEDVALGPDGGLWVLSSLWDHTYALYPNFDFCTGAKALSIESNGSLDPDAGPGGAVSTDGCQLRGLAVQPDGVVTFTGTDLQLREDAIHCVHTCYSYEEAGWLLGLPRSRQDSGPTLKPGGLGGGAVSTAPAAGATRVLAGTVNDAHCRIRERRPRWSACDAAVLTRLTPSGHVDETFGRGGFASVPEFHYCPSAPTTRCGVDLTAREIHALLRQGLVSKPQTQGHKVSLLVSCPPTIDARCRSKLYFRATHLLRDVEPVTAKIRAGKSDHLVIPRPRANRRGHLIARLSVSFGGSVYASERSYGFGGHRPKRPGEARRR